MHSHRHLASPSAADGQNGGPPFTDQAASTRSAGLSTWGVILDAAIGTLGRDKLLMVRVEHQFPGRSLMFHSLPQRQCAILGAAIGNSISHCRWSGWEALPSS